MEIVIQLPRDKNKLCRTCMNTAEDHKNSFDHYIVHNNQLTELSKMLSSVTSTKIAVKDGLPETLCSQCVEQLKTAYAFKNQCKNVDASLRKLLSVSEKSECFDDLPPKSSAVVDNVEESDHLCQVCSDTFESYYNLSRHMIRHNAEKSLSERFLNNHSEDSHCVMDYDVEACFDEDILNLVKGRKSCTSDTNNQTENKSVTADVIASPKSKAQPDTLPIKKTTKVSDIYCKICSQTFKSRKELISHVCAPLKNDQENAADTKDNKPVFTCSLCNKTLPDNSALSIHFLKHALTTEDMTNSSIESEFLICETCGQSFESHFDLEAHYVEKHDEKPTWPCPDCTLVFKKEVDLLRHCSIHSNKIMEDSANTENFPCMLCSEAFTAKEDLLKHSVAHLMKKYSCKKCLASFCTQHAYFAHLVSHPGYQYTCATCGQHLSTKSALKSHIVGVHSVDLRHTCSVCGKRFATASRLKTHSEIHTSYKKYVCTYCGYSAHKVGDLQIHTRIHTSERPYKCTFAKCTMSFKTSSHLCDHVRRHLQIRRFKCDVCSMGFATNHGLKIHQMQHTGEKPHSCAVCDQKFRRKYHVKVHMKQHNPALS